MNMKLTIKRGYRSRNMLQGLVKGRYNMLEFIEGEEYYNFTFTDTEIPRIVEVKLQRQGQWDDVSDVDIFMQNHFIFMSGKSANCLNKEGFQNQSGHLFLYNLWNSPRYKKLGDYFEKCFYTEA